MFYPALPHVNSVQFKKIRIFAEYQEFLGTVLDVLRIPRWEGMELEYGRGDDHVNKSYN